MNIVVFEDAGVEQLFPVTTGRAAYAVTCASYRLVDWIAQMQGHPVGLVRPHLVALQQLDYPLFQPAIDPAREWTVVINARLTPSASNFRKIQKLVETSPSSARVIRSGSAVAAAVIPTRALAGQDSVDLIRTVDDYCQGTTDLLEVRAVELSLIEYPHDLIRENLNSFSENLEFRIASGEYREVLDGVFVAGDHLISDFVVADTSDGPILLERDVRIGPFTVLRGPIYVGPFCRVNEHASIKDCVSLGHTTKIGGEIESTIIEPYSNKQHHGFLGHSYLGSWINLGAGTCNSDLKNTYGTVNMEYGGQRVPTNMQFVGCVMGDYAKSAINTGIFTGKTIGVCSMIYGFVTTNVPSFVNYARLFGQTTELPPGVMQSTQKRMFGRRNVHQRPCDLQLIEDMYSLTIRERQLSGEPLVL